MTDSDATGGEAERPLNPIACGHCRQRKRKCDRQLPYCLQCSHDPSNCHYPEQNKRGIPIGFITRLEARLAETEEALFQVLQSLENNPENAQLSLKPPSQRKADRIREWDTLPLKSLADIKTWFQSKSEPGNSMAAPLRVAQTELSLPIQRTVATPEISASITDPQSSERTTSPLQDMGSESLLNTTWEGSSDTTMSKAKSLEQRRPNIYF
ncbi:Zn(2)-C6 fungal-type domain-containing protein [Fusarium keratoplasticum]|nr:Zn(2)-C6 fungal-type domain-containing protein [Fusarium keratoplasticum]